MKRIIMMVLRNILLVPWMWFRLCYHASHVDKYTEEEHYRMLQYITHRANKGGNVKIGAHGLENIPKENGFLATLQKKTISAIVSKLPRKELPSVKLPTVLPLKQQRLPVNVSFTNVMPV